MNEIDDIVPDTVLELTPELNRAFRAVGCIPMCHCCEKRIHISQKFKLAYVKRPHTVYRGSTDEMLCYHCTPAKLLAAEAKRRAEQRRRGGGYTRPHGGNR